VNVFDWLPREGGIVLSWWALVTAAGIGVLPLSFRLLRCLPDRGYTLARALGLLLTGFVFWLLAMFGFIRNTPGSMILAWVIVLVAGLIVYLRDPIDLRAWWRENRAVVIVGEVLFFVLLFAWAIYRAHQNAITFTEKPMELAFLSSVMRSEVFPPADPWLSGYAISYYYFGYVIAGMLSKLSGITSTIGFNMTAALLFALTGIGAFGVVYNLVRSRANGSGEPKRSAAIWTGIIGMIFVVLLGNFQLALVEVPYQTNTAPQEYLAFWDMNERQNQIGGPGSADLNDWGNWWWFRSARVLNDRNFDNSREEVIDEFPQFSFLLADNHPHVLSLPFAVLALGLALNVILSGRKPNRSETVLYGLVIGGLIFLNTWDGPIYAAALLGAEAVRRLIRTGRLTLDDLLSVFWLALTLVVVAVVAYLPFIISFRSQAAGVVPNLVYPTLFRQFFIMFGPLLLILAPFLVLELWRGWGTLNWRFAIRTGVIVLGGLILLLVLFSVVGYVIPALRNQVGGFIESNGGLGRVVSLAVSKRVTHSLTALVLTLGVILVLARMFPRRSLSLGNPAAAVAPIYPPATGFALLLVGLGLMLTLTPEFVYLRDNFSTRMNTVFKFYYGAWLVWSVAAAYAVYTIVSDHQLMRPPVSLRAVFIGGLALVMAFGLMFPVAGVYHRAIVEAGRTFSEVPVTLDGGPSFTWADDYQVALCLGEQVEGNDVTVAQAVGGQYHGEFGTVATLTGLPVLLNWVGHQQQWRGVEGYAELGGTRDADIQTLYTSPTWRDTAILLNQYGVDYVVFGTIERSTFGAESEIKFLDNLDIVCETGGSRIYRVTPEAIQFSQ
jgi:YYY domain-containing protein